MLEDGGFALALMDIRMPGMNGVDVLKRIREAGLDVAVIMMTAHGSEELVVECMTSGAVDYISKPFSLDDMLQRVERAVARRLGNIASRAVLRLAAGVRRAHVCEPCIWIASISILNADCNIGAILVLT